MYQIYMPNCCENDGIKKCETEKWNRVPVNEKNGAV